MAFNRKQLKKLYPDADENYLMVLLEGKLYSINYIKARKKEIRDEFEKYYNQIHNLFVDYLESNKRDYFIADDFKKIDKSLKRKIFSVLMEFYTWSAKHYISSVSEFYNYKLYYNLWVFETIEEEVLGGEMSKTSFSNSKLSKLLNSKQYGYTYTDRLKSSINLSEEEVNNVIRGITSKDGATLEDVKRLMNRRLTKAVANKMSNAEGLGLENIDWLAEEEAYEDIDTLSAFGGKWVRVEILDKKTCFTCASIDGKIFKERLGTVHPNCRGIDVPYNMSDDKATRVKDKLNREVKRQKRFDTWFDNLSEKDKKRVLGKKKYLRYVAGKTDVHNLVKQVHVDGIKPIKSRELAKVPDSIKNNAVLNATKSLKQEYSKLPKKRITNISNIDEYTAYKDYLSKKERMYKNLSMTELRKAGIKRQSLLEEVYKEKRLLRQIKSTLK